MWWIIVFIVFIVIFLVWLGVIFYQRRISLKIEALDQEKNHLLDHHLDEEFAKLEQENPTGESLASLNRLQQEYNHLKNRKLVDLETFFFEAEDSNNKFQFFQGRRKIAELEKRIKEAKDLLTKIQSALSQIQNVQNQDKELMNQINDDLSTVKRKILSQGYAYGPAQDNLEHRLARIDENYDQVQQVYLSGDYAKAKVQFTVVKKETADLNHDMQKIADLYERLNKSFPEQIDEIKTTYVKFKNLGYCFIDDDFDDQLLDLQNSLNQTIELLNQAAVTDIQQNCTKISEKIKKLYTVLQREYNSRRQVQRDKTELYQFIVHAERQNRSLRDTVYHCANVFIIPDEELKKATKFEIQIEDIRLNYNRDMQKVFDKEAVFSVINRNFELYRKELTEIEKSQVKIANLVAQDYQDLSVYKKDLLVDESALKVIVRYVEKENLPGVPQDYQEFYLVVNNELKKFHNLLQTDKINLTDIKKVANMLQEDLLSLADRTNEIVKNSRLTEILIQNVIQHQSKRPEVTTKINQAKQIYSKKYDYEASMNILAKELELIKPGAFQEIVDNYDDHDQLNLKLNEMEPNEKNL